jgi:hypothetical protein
MDVFTINYNLVRVTCQRAITKRPKPQFIPTSKARQVESEVWMLRFGSPGKHQLDILPSNVIGMPAVFKYHPFCSINFKKQAYIRKQAAQCAANHIPTCGAAFFMDYAFM